MPDLNHLKKEHAELAALARQLSRMIAQDTPADSQELYELRMKLASGLIRHLKTEDWVLYPRLLASSDEQVVLTARAFSASMGGLAEDFRTYTDRWSATAINDDWTGYQRETFEILQALEVRMNRENRDLYPLLEADVRVSSATSR